MATFMAMTGFRTKAHVWGHFCLSYEGQKLINDKARIQTFGIKDDDQLNNSSVRPLSRDEEKEQRTFANHSDNNENQDYDSKYHCEDHDDIPTSEFKLAHFLRGWLSRKGSQGQSRPSRFSLQCLGGEMAEKIRIPEPATSFEYEPFEGDPEHLRIVVATPKQISPWIEAAELKL
ncbi:hypothetical protein GH714_034238 [Hevea brasiliensis]|uniref:SNRNP25 ubiquitin-like domain-containing protein n=1 Tax=Hevea brasiliensis TaxID=3981 RepID=A0A6A6NDY5_HEVBR|nr:hypothetical protein GH714_034238 [Hevea brasiliensis]